MKSDKYAAPKFVIRDVYGNPIFTASRKIGKYEVFIAEDTGFKEDLIVAQHYGYNNIMVEGTRFKLFIDSINKACSIQWSINIMVQDIKIYLLVSLL